MSQLGFFRNSRRGLDGIRAERQNLRYIVGELSSRAQGADSVAHHEEETGGMHHDTGHNSITYGLSYLSGGGLTLMIGALMIGVVAPDSGTIVTLLFLAGLGMLIAGIAAWLGTERPHEKFDDINVPLYHGHDDHADDEHALTVAESTAVEAMHAPHH
jgi:hypothetical protein